MVRNTNVDEQTERAQLNSIADHWTEQGKYPGGISMSDVQELGQVLRSQVEEHLESLVADTTFTRREAEVWVLLETVDEDNYFLTEDAATLILSTPGAGFSGGWNNDEQLKMCIPATSEEVQEHYAAAKQKVEQAKETLGAVTFPNREDALSSPKMVWLDSQTAHQLQSRCQSNEDTLNDVTTRLLNETETRRSLEDFARDYLDARAQDNVAQLAIQRQSLETGALHITAHTAAHEELPDIVTETDAITYHDHRYDLHFDEDPSGPHENHRITLYASDTITGMDGVPLKEGLSAADDHMRDVLEREKPLPTRQID